MCVCVCVWVGACIAWEHVRFSYSTEERDEFCWNLSWNSGFEWRFETIHSRIAMPKCESRRKELTIANLAIAVIGIVINKTQSRAIKINEIWNFQNYRNKIQFFVGRFANDEDIVTKKKWPCFDNLDKCTCFINFDIVWREPRDTYRFTCCYCPK